MVHCIVFDACEDSIYVICLYYLGNKILSGFSAETVRRGYFESAGLREDLHLCNVINRV